MSPLEKINAFNFIVIGNPRGKGRPRSALMGKGAKRFISVYSPKETVNYEKLVKAAFRKAYPSVVLAAPDHPLCVSVAAFFEIPKSWSQKKRLASSNMVVKKPDGDNILKIICDALNKEAFHDDSQVSTAVIRKRYSEGPGYVRVRISQDYGL